MPGCQTLGSPYRALTAGEGPSFGMWPFRHISARERRRRTWPVPGDGPGASISFALAPPIPIGGRSYILRRPARGEASADAGIALGASVVISVSLKAWRK